MATSSLQVPGAGVQGAVRNQEATVWVGGIEEQATEGQPKRGRPLWSQPEPSGTRSESSNTPSRGERGRCAHRRAHRGWR
jgi:hypothetical protein